jgi:MYXO-CTERM domain-containing protein
MLPATTLNTQPFYNSVLVLPVFLRDIGITAEQPVISYAAFTQSSNVFEKGEQSSWASFDVQSPLVDATPDGILFRPIFSGDQALVTLGAAALEAAEPPQILLLHHTNQAGKRYEIVELGSAPGNVAIALTAPEAVASGEQISFSLTAVNQKSSSDTAVSLSGSLSGATIATLDPACSAIGTNAFTCDLGALPQSAEVSLAIEAIATPGATSAKLEVSAQTDLPCETSSADNTASASVALQGAQPTGTDDDELAPGGGCACRVGGPPRSSPTLAAIAAALALALSRRRRLELEGPA